MHMGIQMSLWDSGWSSFGSHGHSSLLCLLIFVDICTIFHSYCSTLYPHIFSVYSVPAFPCCLVILAISLLAIHTPLSRSVLSCSIYYQLCSLYSLLIFRRPLHMLEMNQLPEPTGLMMLVKCKERTRLPKTDS